VCVGGGGGCKETESKDYYNRHGVRRHG
jgi:hypothetical protein